MESVDKGMRGHLLGIQQGSRKLDMDGQQGIERAVGLLSGMQPTPATEATIG